MNRVIFGMFFLSLTCEIFLSQAVICAADSGDVHRVAASLAPWLVRIETIGGRDAISGTPTSEGAFSGVWFTTQEDSRVAEVVTSLYPFRHEPSAIIVRFHGGESRSARRVASDFTTLVTLLHIDAPPQPAPPPLPLGVPDDVPLGATLFALGTALSPDNTNASVGILSGRRRLFGKALQTDAAISPYNEGGILATLDGFAIGLIVPLSTTDASRFADPEMYDSGIGFAIPMTDLTERIVPRLRAELNLHAAEPGLVFNPTSIWIGDATLARVVPDSPAARAGLRAGDKIVAVNGRSVTTARDVVIALTPCYAGDAITLTFRRAGEADTTVILK